MGSRLMGNGTLWDGQSLVRVIRHLPQGSNYHCTILHFLILILMVPSPVTTRISYKRRLARLFPERRNNIIIESSVLFRRCTS
jgi:hypothetical protein